MTDSLAPEQLRAVIDCANNLAEYREQTRDDDEEEAQSAERLEEIPEDVPSKATITEINDNRYYYWQWRDSDKIRSQYKGPVNPDE